MTRELFLQELRIALQGQISQVQINDQLRYYEYYIIEESRKGRTEEEVIDSLGSPRLIAKTIIQTYGNAVYQEARAEEEYGPKEKGGKFRLWFSKLILCVFGVLFLMLLVKIGLFLLPILVSAFMIGAIIYVIFRIFFGNKK